MSSTGDIWRQLLAIAVGSVCVLGANCVTAQITPDRTLPNNSSVTINGSVFNITGGTQAGRNLFHSFQQFSVPTGGTAFFNNALDIQNISQRVAFDGTSSDGMFRSGIFSRVEVTGQGKGGDIRITSNEISVSNSAAL